MVGMRMSMGPALTQSMGMYQRQRQIFSLEQRQTIRAHQTGLQIELVAALRNERFIAAGCCPSCRRELKPNEILAGFTQDVHDFTTQCTGCRRRFEPSLICFGEASQVEIPFYCGVQARHRLSQLSDLSPAQIARQMPGAYRSAVVHFGTLAAMYESIKIVYTYPELENWQAKALPFLGRMPDVVVARCVNVCVEVIGKLRRKHKITKYTKQRALEEATY